MNKIQIDIFCIVTIVMLLPWSILGGMVSDSSMSQNQVEPKSVYSFNYANISLTDTWLSNNETSYDVIFYGTGWSQYSIENWKSYGTVHITDEAQIEFINILNNSTLTVAWDSVVHINDSSLSTLEVDHNAMIYLTNSEITELTYGNSLSSATVEVKDTSIDLYENEIYVKTVSYVNRYHIFGDISGINLTIDDFSSIEDTYFRILGYSAIDSFELMGDPNIRYYINIQPSTPADIYIKDVTLDYPSQFYSVSNLTLVNIKIQLNYEYTIYSLKITQSNGTIDGIYDISEDDVSTHLSLVQSQMHLYHAELDSLSIETISSLYDHPFIEKINITSSVIETVYHQSLQTTNFYNTTVGQYIKYAVALGPISYWHADYYYSAMRLANGIGPTSENDTIYEFVVFNLANFTIEDSDARIKMAENSTIYVKGGVVNKISDTKNVTIVFTHAKIEDFELSANSTYTFYHSIFNDDLAIESDNSDINFNLYNSSGNAYIIGGGENITMVDSSFGGYWMTSGTDAVQEINLVRSDLDWIQMSFYSQEHYLYITNSSIVNINNQQSGPFTGLHIHANNSFIWGTTGFNPATLFEYYDIQLQDTVFGVLNEIETTTTFTETGIEITWNNPATSYGSKTETGEYTIYRREWSEDQLPWDDREDWQEMSSISAQSYTDNDVVKGMIYEYLVIKHYNDISVRFQVDNVFPALTGYKLVLNHTVPVEDREEIYNLSDSSTLAIGFDLRIFNPVTNYIIWADTPGLVIEYELILDDDVVQTGTFDFHDVRIEISEAGSYLLKVRSKSAQVQVWSDWAELEFTITQSETEQSSSEEVSKTEEDLSLNLSIWLAILPIFVTATIIGVKRKD